MSLKRLLSHTRPFSTTTGRTSHVGSRPVPISSAVTYQFIQAARPPPMSPAGPASSPNVELHRSCQSAEHRGSETDRSSLQLTGPRGAQTVFLPDGISASFLPPTPTSSAQVKLSCAESKSRKARSDWGLTRALLANAVQGVTEGFNVKVRLVGVGYRASVEADAQAPAADGATSAAPAGRCPATQPAPRSQLVLRLGYPRPIRIPIPPEITCNVLSPTEIEVGAQDKHLLGHFAAEIRRWRVPEPYNGKGIFVGGETVRRKEVKKK